MRPGELSIGGADLEAMRAQASAARPREACGLLVGRREGERVVVERVVAARNVAAGEERFEVDPGDHLEAQRAARAEGLEVVGAWHSHPRGPAAPSASDAREAVQGWVLVVVDAGDGSWGGWWAGAEGLVELARGGASRIRD